MLTIQAIVQLVLVAVLSASHILLWPELLEQQGGWQIWLLFAANWSALFFFVYSLAHIMHEGSHYHLSRNRWLNEFLFCAAGMPVLGAPSLFRAVHFRHHGFTNQFADLALLPQIRAQREPERRKRRIAMIVLLAGILNGISYFRQLGKSGSALDKRVRRRAWLELAIAIPILLTLSVWWWLHQGLASWSVGFLAPLLLASWLHGWQELCEHYGMQEGATAEASRSVLPSNPLAKAVYGLLFNFNYHAVHHHWPHVPAHQLPSAHERYTAKLHAKGEAAPPVYAGYCTIVFRHVIPQLVRDFFSKHTTPANVIHTADFASEFNSDLPKAA